MQVACPFRQTGDTYYCPNLEITAALSYNWEVNSQIMSLLYTFLVLCQLYAG